MTVSTRPGTENRGALEAGRPVGLHKRRVHDTERFIREFRSALVSRRNTLLQVAREVDPVVEFAHSVAQGLEETPRKLDCRYLYDARGSELYEEITRQPEYYPTRTEAAILRGHATEILDHTGPVTLVELGSGSSTKTDTLLGAAVSGHSRACYIPVDVSQSALLQAGEQICKRRPNVHVIAIHGAFEDALPVFESASPLILVFLGSTVGNLDERQADRFWAKISAHLMTGDFVLLGVDLVKDVDTLEAAYDDDAGVTEAFTLNLFARMNRELGADLDVDRIEHVARFNEESDRIEILARFTQDQRLRVEPLEQDFRIEAGEEILVEISRKFRLDKLLPRLRSHGLQERRMFTDERNWFGVLLLQKTGE
jgi:L-histidine N-alpha-methyltransferase